MVKFLDDVVQALNPANDMKRFNELSKPKDSARRSFMIGVYLVGKHSLRGAAWGLLLGVTLGYVTNSSVAEISDNCMALGLVTENYQMFCRTLIYGRHGIY